MNVLLAARVLAGLTVANVLVSFVTAGDYLQTDQGSAEEAHGIAAIVLHVITGLLAISLVLRARETSTGWPAAAVAVVLFVYTFIQASISGTLLYHVTGGFFVAVVPVALLAWLLTRASSPTRAS